jgi:hypothetical protein
MDISPEKKETAIQVSSSVVLVAVALAVVLGLLRLVFQNAWYGILLVLAIAGAVFVYTRLRQDG